VRNQPVELFLDNGIALAAVRCQIAAVNYGDMAAPVFNHSLSLQIARGFSDALPANSQHVRNRFLGKSQLIARQAVKKQQQPAA